MCSTAAAATAASTAVVASTAAVASTVDNARASARVIASNFNENLCRVMIAKSN